LIVHVHPVTVTSNGEGTVANAIFGFFDMVEICPLAKKEGGS
jgi:hypothetical protein